MMSQAFPWQRAHPALAPRAPGRLQRTAAVALHVASRALQRLALRLAHAAPVQPTQGGLPPLLEFHAEAGAPEGALFVDGHLVAHLIGVRRL